MSLGGGGDRSLRGLDGQGGGLDWLLHLHLGSLDGDRSLRGLDGLSGGLDWLLHLHLGSLDGRGRDLHLRNHGLHSWDDDLRGFDGHDLVVLDLHRKGRDLHLRKDDLHLRNDDLLGRDGLVLTVRGRIRVLGRRLHHHLGTLPALALALALALGPGSVLA